MRPIPNVNKYGGSSASPIEMGDVPVVMHDIQKFTHVIYRDKISRKSDSTGIKKIRTIYYKFRTLSKIRDISGQIIKKSGISGKLGPRPPLIHF